MNFQSFKWDIEFIHEMVRTGAPVAVIGGGVAVAFGFILDIPSMIFVGAFILLVISVDYVIFHFFGGGSAD